MNFIEGHLVVAVVIRALNQSVWSLNDSKWRFFSIRTAAEEENSLGERAVDDNFVVNRIVRQTVHGPADHCLLTFERSNGN